MAVIVTGATGFIGRHLVDALARRGEAVRALSRGVGGGSGAEMPEHATAHRVDYGRADLGLADDTLRGVSAVYHLAGATRAVSSDRFGAANLQPTERLLDRLVGLGERPRFVYVSSQAAAGPAPDAGHPKRESDTEAPIEGYGRSKLAAERAVAARSAELPVTIVRPVAVYGPGDRDFLSIFAMATRGVAVYPGIKHSSVNTIFVADLVRGMLAAATAAAAVGRTYFLGDDEPQPWTQIYATIADVVGKAGEGAALELSVPRTVIAIAGQIGDAIGTVTGKPSLVGRSKARLAMPKYWLCTSARAREELAFSTPTSLREGMRVTYDWYVRHRWL